MLKRAYHHLMRDRRVALAILLLVVLNIALGYYAFCRQPKSDELRYLSENTLSFKELTEFFSDLANKKGAVYAFGILKEASISPNIDIHLLGHVVGDILYDQQGSQAITLCTQDFRNACSHTIVIGSLLEKGPQSLREMGELCKQAPGGIGAYGMCFHGLGHGVLAYNDYDLSKAVSMCKTLKTDRGPEFVECVGGTIMEMIAGVHDREAWLAQKDNYFKKSDPLYPCSGSVIPNEAKKMCYTYITPHFFQEAGADLGMPKPEHFKKAFTYCEDLDGVDREACFGGFGKEFVVLAQNRDVRAIEKMGKAELSLVFAWCDLAGPVDGKESCIGDAIRSLYWGGENKPDAAIKFCEIAKEGGLGDACAEALIQAVSIYVKDSSYREDVCNRMPSNYNDMCRSSLL